VQKCAFKSFVDFGSIYIVCVFTWLPPLAVFFTYFSLLIYFLTYLFF